MRKYNGSDFASADAHLGKLDGITIGNNTRLERRGPDAIGVRLHGTYVVTYTRAGDAILSAGGWQTTTTADRLNRYSPSPWRVGSDRGTWKLYRSGHPVADFANGITIRADGSVGLFDTRHFGYPAWPIETLMSAEDVQAAVDADIARREHLDELRAVRNADQHARGIGRHTSAGHRFGVRDCPPCHVDESAARDRERAVLLAEHAAMLAGDNAAMGSHRTVDRMATWPQLPNGRADYSAQPTYSDRVRVACPWQCPEHRYS